MKKGSHNFKIKYRVIFTLFFIISVLVIVFLIIAAKCDLFSIQKSDWLNALFAWTSAISAIFLGIIAYSQNERFKIESDISSAKMDIVQKEHQAELFKLNQQAVEINNRLLQLEENKEKAYLAFLQKEVIVCNLKDDKFLFDGKSYRGGFPDENGKHANDGTIFKFKITNQTNVPIRNFQIERFSVSIKNWETDDDNLVIKKSAGAFIPSPIIDKSEEVEYIFLVPDIYDLAENLKGGYEIVLMIDISVTSIYDRTIEQGFLLRLQRGITGLPKEVARNVFSLYCFESKIS